MKTVGRPEEDPFGYKGLSWALIRSVIKDWGSDCVFFFNYSRINAGINNPIVNEHMEALFWEGELVRVEPTAKGMRYGVSLCPRGAKLPDPRPGKSASQLFAGPLARRSERASRLGWFMNGFGALAGTGSLNRFDQ